ncbi:hypothetical protein Gorai_023320 [Gossypium raimondii]|uniref:Uncharacterized protein n=3 Tax=Gossypium raimondii TaxID=29730 RepID=A0A7J8NWC6_GOSRA|nr:hypothetical protein [Gossypium raimondii]
MLSTKKLIRMERKWRKMAAIGRKTITSTGSTRRKVADEDHSSESSVGDKGHFVVYTADKKRFVIPLSYLNNSIFQELFKMSEEEFGLSSDGPITFPCDSVIMSYIVLLVRRGLAKDLEKAVLNSITSNSFSSYSTFFLEGHAEKQLPVCGFSSATQMEASMITSKKLMRMTRKWQKMASIGRKRIASTRPTRKMAAANHSNKSSIVDKGCFSIYTMDKKRFVIPLAFLSNSVFRELFNMSEEEFGLPSDGPITLPCDSVVMNYIVSIVKRGLAKDLEKAVLNFITTYSCSLDTYADQGHADQQSVLVCGF